MSHITITGLLLYCDGDNRFTCYNNGKLPQMEDTNTSSYYSGIQTGKSRNLPLIIIIVVIALVGGVFIYFQSQKQKSAPMNKAVVTIAPTEEPSPTEKPKIDKKTVKIQVLNGTGTPGQASTAVDALKKADYVQENIKTDNAPDFNHTSTSISARAGFEDIANDIKQTLAGTFDNVEIDTTQVDKFTEFDVVVITGGKKFEETTATSSPTLSPSKAPTSTPTP